MKTNSYPHVTRPIGNLRECLVTTTSTILKQSPNHVKRDPMAISAIIIPIRNSKTQLEANCSNLQPQHPQTQAYIIQLYFVSATIPQPRTSPANTFRNSNPTRVQLIMPYPKKSS